MITRKPQPNETIIPDNGEGWKVHHCREGICYSVENEGNDNLCFIYQFSDGTYNKLHTIKG